MTDLISRQAAIDAIKRYESDDYDLNNGLILAMNAVADVPAIEPKNVVEDYCRPRNLMVVGAECFRLFTEPKPGRWIDGKHMGFDGCFVWHRECSLCGYEREDDNPDKDTPFCPICGHPMARSEE